MKVLYVCAVGRGQGVDPIPSTVAFASAARAAGAEVSVIAAVPRGYDASLLTETLGAESVHTFTSAGVLRAPQGRLQMWRLRREISRHAVVHLHGDLTGTALAAARRAVKNQIPVLWRPLLTGAANRGRRFAFPTRTARSVHILHAASKTELLRASEQYGLDRVVEGFVIPQPWAGEVFQPRPRRRPGDSPSVVFTGELQRGSGAEEMLATWPAVFARYPAANLIFLDGGDSRYTYRLRERAEATPFGKRVSFCGTLSAIGRARVMESASLVVAPPTRACADLSVLEGLAAGLPLVVTEKLYMHGLVEELGVGTVLRSPGLLLGDAVANALSDEALIARARVVGPDRVERWHAMPIAGRELVRIYGAAMRQVIPAVRVGNAEPSRRAV